MKAKLKLTDMVVCPVCEGTGLIDRTADELGTSASSCPHGTQVTYKTFLRIRLPDEKPKKVK